ncbi:kinase-like domain-containing protein [Syncephalis plumigaleata]|nr:kinase-like domain-containing protein [Syncephalis plumigaleata]
MAQPPVLHYSFYTRHESEDEDDVLLASGEQLSSSPQPHQQRRQPSAMNANRISVYDQRTCRHVNRTVRTLPVNGRLYSSKACHRASFSLSGLSSDDSWIHKRSASPLDTAPPKEQKLDTATSSNGNYDDRIVNTSHARYASHTTHHAIRLVHSEEEDNIDADEEDDEEDSSNDDEEMVDQVHALAELQFSRNALLRKRNKLSMSQSTPCTPIRARFASVDAATDGAFSERLSALADDMVQDYNERNSNNNSAADQYKTESNCTSDTAPSFIEELARAGSVDSISPSLSSRSSRTANDPDDDELDCIVDVIRRNPPPTTAATTTTTTAAAMEQEDDFPTSTSVTKQQLQLMVRHRQRHPDYIYHAPCEHYPCQTQTGYLVNDRCRKFDNSLSVVEFGVRAADCLPVTFKTVADTYLAVRELAAFNRVSGVEHVVQLIDTFLDDQSRRVFVFPRLRPLKWAEHNLVDLARLLQQLLSALKHIHECGLVHLDVNPANMLQDASGDLVLIDFGLARDVPVAGPQAGCSSCIRACGTAGFIAPELLGMHPSPDKNEYQNNDEEIDILLIRSVGSIPAKECDDRRRQPQQQALRDGRRCDLFSAGVVFALALVPYLPDDCSSVRCLGSSIATLDTLERSRTELINSLNNPFRDTTIPKVVWQAMEVAAGLLDPNPITRWTTKQALDSSFINAKTSEFVGTELAPYQEARRMARYHRTCAMTFSSRNNYWSDDDLDDTYGIYRY